MPISIMQIFYCDFIEIISEVVNKWSLGKKRSDAMWDYQIKEKKLYENFVTERVRGV